MNNKYGESSTSLLERRQKAFPQQVPHLPSLSNLMTETSAPSNNNTAASALSQPPTMIYNDYNAQPILTTTAATTMPSSAATTSSMAAVAAAAAVADHAALFPSMLEQSTGFVPPLPMQTQLPVYPMHPQQHVDLYNNNMPNTTMSMMERQRQSSVSSSNSDKVYSFVAIPGTNHKKRPRRRYDEIERLYHCNWPGCTKSYGTLNHLNAHVSMQQHVNNLYLFI
jgi:hypothetical protein